MPSLEELLVEIAVARWRREGARRKAVEVLLDELDRIIVEEPLSAAEEPGARSD